MKHIKLFESKPNSFQLSENALKNIENYFKKNNLHFSVPNPIKFIQSQTIKFKTNDLGCFSPVLGTVEVEASFGFNGEKEQLHIILHYSHIQNGKTQKILVKRLVFDINGNLKDVK